jgi:hypothetical protein
MEGFQKIVLITAGVVFFIAVLFITTALLQKSTENWPPIIAQCPDWWVINGSGKNSTCINVKDLGNYTKTGTDEHQTVNFNLPTYTGTNGKCAKYNWAKGFNISWDGITYGVKNPCIRT